MKLQENLSKEERKMMRSVFWRSWTMNASRTGATQYHAVGVIYTLLPVINRFYKTEEERKDALVRHTTWFNATMHLNNFIMGLVSSMEKQNSEDKNFDANSITAVKASLMGPISGIGDSFFWGILRVVAAGIGISLASTGTPLGAIVFLLLYNIPAFLIHYFALYGGYSVGTSFIQKLYESGGMQILTKASSMLGLMMMGSMTASNVNFETILEVNVAGSEETMQIQEYLDQLFVGIVPLAVTLGAFWLLRKKVNVNWVMLGIMCLGILLGLLGIA
ncbi:PTS system mannose/fructose/sorbose family transporter subunit IID [Tetragenococcus halophilus]|uniref:PTS mannose transporter subunit IID n=3 Tax=Tetragenococcus halophilus TaxID=51669 RepID=A0AB35HRE0_TETHA|nr:PTS system mannose/fructose/sorbose family transporter subunit IID [Tetragenococcus halophilus]AOF48670.1 PTS mannnose transporter subunit IID [Tetragenococcus halophilus]MCF1675807.1 PTS system mannose/fructose/sorbose family transporter subunit IID [Tetragenococcus halophilus]MCO7026286.1 PTS system mannose/fructose/sorbose family transporter subunit IID [Tetragenococcus halophilus]MCO8283981.1 PTS mannose/fructose/sorbose transporter family subunit IID [Tetragenococcus halophilus]MCO8286